MQKQKSTKQAQRSRQTDEQSGGMFQLRRTFDFVAPLTLDECQRRIARLDERREDVPTRRSHIWLNVRAFKNENNEIQFLFEKATGKNLNIEMDVYLEPISAYQTRVYGGTQLAGRTTLALSLITLTIVLSSCLLIWLMPPMLLAPCIILTVFWASLIHTRNQMLNLLQKTLEAPDSLNLKQKKANHS